MITKKIILIIFLLLPTLAPINKSIYAQNASYYYDKGVGMISIISESDNIKAKEYLTKALELDPDYVKAYAKRAKVNSNLKNYEAAIDDINKAIQLAPNIKYHYKMRAFYHYSLGMGKGYVEVVDKRHIIKAIQDYSTHIRISKSRGEIDGSYYYSINSRSELKYKVGDYYGAIEDINVLIGLIRKDIKEGNEVSFFKRTPKPKRLGIALFQRGFIYQKMNNKNEACKSWSKAGELGVDSAFKLISKFCN